MGVGVERRRCSDERPAVLIIDLRFHPDHPAAIEPEEYGPNSFDLDASFRRGLIPLAIVLK
jgi:hypothetical protein